MNEFKYSLIGLGILAYIVGTISFLANLFDKIIACWIIIGACTALLIGLFIPTTLCKYP